MIVFKPRIRLMNIFGRRTLTFSTMSFGGIMIFITGICFMYEVTVQFGDDVVQPGRWISFIGMLAVSTTFGHGEELFRFLNSWSIS